MTLPIQFFQRMQAMLGEESDAFFESFHRGKSSGLRINLWKTSENIGWNQLPFSLSPVEWCENGCRYDAQAEESTGQRPGKHPFHEAGLYYIQEPSAMLPASLARRWLRQVSAAEGPDAQAAQRAEPIRVLDLCAAPGGKSSQLSEALRGCGILISNEIHPQRAKILSQNMERMGTANAVVISQSPEELSRRWPECFDCIVVDAPCSGEGMFRKDEATTEQWSAEAPGLCARRQKQILSEAVKMLAPGGCLIYSTCTFAPEENEGILLWLLRRFPELAVQEQAQLLQDCQGIDCGQPQWVNDQYCGQLSWDPCGTDISAALPDAEEARQLGFALRLWPHRVCGEGHFAAVLRKSGSPCDRKDWFFKEKKSSFLSRPPKEWNAFAEECFGPGVTPEALVTALCGSGFRWLAFGDQLYAAPPGCPPLSGLTALRPGLHLGTVKKGRFQPSHALALAFSPELLQRLTPSGCCLELGERAEDYLRGESILRSQLQQGPSADARDGWCIVTYCGLPLGFGKLSAGQLKNHYPKGLRWV